MTSRVVMTETSARWKPITMLPNTAIEFFRANALRLPSAEQRHELSALIAERHASSGVALGSANKRLLLYMQRIVHSLPTAALRAEG